jgi:hypothetical protein
MRKLFHGVAAISGLRAAWVGVSLFLAQSPALALNSNVPPTGLPTASIFSATLLPDVQGVVSWKTLSQVEPRKEGDRIVPKFSSEILRLDNQVVRVQGFILPLDLGDHQHHFLLSAVPPHCPFCLPAGPDAIVEVVAKQGVEYSFEPVILEGKFAVLKNSPEGLLYRLAEAQRIASSAK